MDLLVIQPGETLGGCWWNYRAYSGPIAAGIYRPRSATTIVGLALIPDGTPLPSPLADTTYDWLWWEVMIWETAAAGSTDYVWLYQSWGPKIHRKVETMRKGDPTVNSTLSVIVETDEADGSSGFVNDSRYQCNASALVILP